MHRHDWANARYKLAACNPGGCSDSNRVDTIGAALQAVGYFKASNTQGGDIFGYAVALSADGKTPAVAAIGEDSAATGIDGDETNGGAAESGAVYVFARTGNGWSQQAYLKASNTGANDSFGLLLALSANGDTLAVSAPLESSAATGINGNEGDDSMTNAGAVYVFRRASSAWSQLAYVKSSSPDVNDQFGSALSLSADGGSLAVGATAEDGNATGINGDPSNNGASAAGAVYLY